MNTFSQAFAKTIHILCLFTLIILWDVGQTNADTEVISKKPPVRETTSIKLSHMSLRDAVRLVCGNLRCRFNNVPDDILSKEISISLANITTEEALQYIAESNDLILQKGADTMVFQGLESYTHVFRKPPLDENYSASFYEGELGGTTTGAAGGGSGGGGNSGQGGAPSSGASGSGAAGSGGTSGGSSQGVTITSSVDKLSFWGDLDNNLKKIISSQGFYSIDRSSSLIFLTDKPSRVKIAKDFIEAIDKNVNKQVSVEVTIVEVHKGGSTSYGVEWDTILKLLDRQLEFTAGGTLSPFSTGDTPFTIGVKLTGNDGTHSTIIKALEKYADVKVIEKTTLLLRNNIAGSISRGTQYSYLDSVSRTIMDQTLTTTVVKGQILSGLNIYLLPTIIGDTVTLNFMPRLSELERLDVIPIDMGEIQNPVIDIRKNFLTVTLKNHETKIVSSIESDNKGHEDQSVPVLNKLPLIGWMFGSKTTTDEQKAIMFILTPTIEEI